MEHENTTWKSVQALAVHVLAETTTAKCYLKEILIKKGEE